MNSFLLVALLALTIALSPLGVVASLTTATQTTDEIDTDSIEVGVNIVPLNYKAGEK